MSDLRKIVIVGGGPAGLAAALSLTDPALHPRWREEYTVTVLQLGWRLGGKGATGRRGEVVADGAGGWRLEGDARIQEHGIHLFGSMYVNATRLLDTCLQELPGAPAIDDELVPSNYIQLADYVDRRWWLTPQILPHNDLEPWGPRDYPDPVTLVAEVLDLVRTLIIEALTLVPDPGEGQLHVRALRRIAEREREDGHLPHLLHHRNALAVLDDARRWLRDQWEEHGGAGDHAARLRSVWCQVEMYVTVAKGVAADEIFTKGLETVDGEVFLDWLRRHGMDEVALASSPVQVPAQMCFQFPDGDVSRAPTFSAAGYLWFVLRQVLACGQGSYWFKRGTGDTVIAPFYRVAKERGVAFEFFRKVERVAYDEASGRVERIDVGVQATTVDGADYDPLVVVPDGTLAWPDRPIYAQLEQGAELREQGIDLESWWTPWQPVATETLVVGEDFDEVVMALPLPCLPFVAPELTAVAPWRDAVEGLGGIATMAAQIWTGPTTRELGFPKLAGTDRVCGAAAVPPLGFADMSDVLEAENWPVEGGPQGLVYLCGPMAHEGPWPGPEAHETPELHDDRALAAFTQWLRTGVSVLPASGTDPYAPEAFDPSLLWCRPGTDPVGEPRVREQYWRANIDPNERYVPSPPGNGSLRPQAWDSGATNLALASDWIFTGMNIGSFEGAVMSGYLAAHALTGLPALDQIVGYGFARPGADAPDGSTRLAGGEESTPG